MDLVQYRGVDFPVVRTIGVERAQIMDPSGSTYLYTRWRGNFVVTYNPGAIAYRPGPLATKAGVAPGAPKAGPYRAGIMPASTDFAIRAWINKPRGLLKVWSGDVLVLQSPLTINGVTAACDAATGPILKANDIVFIPGERRWDIHLSIETCFIDPTFAAGDLPPIISNRWYAIGETDFQQKLVRAYQGLVTVRGDWMRSSGTTTTMIDQLRSTFAAFSVPRGFQRVAVNVRAMPDGNSAEYTIVDSQQMWNKDARRTKGGVVCPAIKLEIQDSGWFSRLVENLSSDNLMGLINVPGAGNAILQAARVLVAGNLGGFLPKAYRSVHIRAWGVSTMNRAELVRFCLNMANARLQQIALFDIGTDETLVSQDTNNFVSVQMTRSWDYATLGTLPFLAYTGALALANISSIQGALGVINSWTDNPDYLYQAPPNPAAQPPGPAIPVAVPPRPTPRDFVQAFPRWPDGAPHVGLTVNPPFLDSGTRGTYLESLVTQALEAPDTLPSSTP